MGQALGGVKAMISIRLALSRPERLTMLRGQLAIIRMQAEQGIPVSVESIARAERLARGLEAEELTA